MSIGIYKIENLLNNKIYIGQSIHIEKRWQEHCKASTNSLIAKAIRKYGKENFSFQILEEVSNITELNELESKYIQQFNSLVPNGYNIMIEDNNQHHQFIKYDYLIFLEIVDKIKNSNLSFQEIAIQYDLDLSMIYYLNRGDYHTLPNESYPLREIQDMSKKKHHCKDCGCEISKGAQRCLKCDHIRQYKVRHPNREELKNLIRSTSFVKIGKKYGVSDNTIRKWCQKEGLPSKASEIKRYTDSQWKEI